MLQTCLYCTLEFSILKTNSLVFPGSLAPTPGVGDTTPHVMSSTCSYSSQLQARRLITAQDDPETTQGMEYLNQTLQEKSYFADEIKMAK